MMGRLSPFYKKECNIKKMSFTKEEKNLLLELIVNKQIYMIIKDYTKYKSTKYKMLEKLKIKIKKL